MISFWQQLPSSRPSSTSSTGWPVALRNLMSVLKELDAGATARPTRSDRPGFILADVAEGVFSAIDRHGHWPAAVVSEHLEAVLVIEPDGLIVPRSPRRITIDPVSTLSGFMCMTNSAT